MRAGTKALRAAYFLLVTFGLPVFFSQFLIENVTVSALCYTGAIVLAYLASLLPPTVGKTRAFPLRVPAAVLAALVTVCCPLVYVLANGVFFLRGVLAGLICGVLLLFAVREISLEYPVWLGQQSGIIGIICYLIPGVAFRFTDAPAAETVNWVMALVFLLAAGFVLNNLNLLSGLATRRNSKPPKSLVTGNRIATVVFALIAAVIVFWAQLRDTCSAAFGWLVYYILEFINWLTNLFQKDNATGGAGGGDPSSMLGDLGDAEPGAFWLIAEKIAMYFAVIAFAAGILFLLWNIGKLLRRLWRKIRAYMERYSKAATEEWIDEQETLFDLDDWKDRTREKLTGAIRSLFTRPKKWEDMSVSERIRYCVRALYKRTEAERLRTMTIREAASQLNHPGISDEALADVYERARYSLHSPEASEAEDLRKAVRP